MQEGNNSSVPPSRPLPQPPAAMPTPLKPDATASADSSSGILDQSGLAALLKKADQAVGQAAAPSEHPPIDVNAPRPGNVIEPGSNLNSLPPKPAAPNSLEPVLPPSIARPAAARPVVSPPKPMPSQPPISTVPPPAPVPIAPPAAVPKPAPPPPPVVVATPAPKPPEPELTAQPIAVAKPPVAGEPPKPIQEITARIPSPVLPAKPEAVQTPKPAAAPPPEQLSPAPEPKSKPEPFLMDDSEPPKVAETPKPPTPKPAPKAIAVPSPALPTIEWPGDDLAVPAPTRRLPSLSLNFGRLLHPSLFWPLALLLLAALIVLMPSLRYQAAGLVVKRNFSVEVLDSTTGAPVSDATVTGGGASATTNAAGVATLPHLKPGSGTIQVSKAYYGDNQLAVTVPVFSQKKLPAVALASSGSLVKVTLTNLVSKQVISDATVTVGSAVAHSGSDGSALLSLPAGASQQLATIKASGYNQLGVNLVTSDSGVGSAPLSLTPAGKAYFWANSDGRYSLRESNLDGSNLKSILKPTGNEGPEARVIASPDNKYLAILVRRTADPHSQVYVESASDRRAKEVDFAQGKFKLLGWQGDRLVYSVTYDNFKPWQKGSSAIESYDANLDKLVALSHAGGIGNAQTWAYQRYNLITWLGDEVAYGLTWVTSANAPASLLANYKNSLNLIRADGSKSQTLASYSAASYSLSFSQYLPASLYIRRISAAGAADHFFNYNLADSQPTAADTLNLAQFSQTHPSFYRSPSGHQTAWNQGSQIIIGDSTGQSPKAVATSGALKFVSWYSDDYMLAGHANKLYVLNLHGGSPVLISSNYYGG